MGRITVLLIAILLTTATDAIVAQRRGAAPARRTPPATPPRKEPAVFNCPAPLGTGVTSKKSYCDVLTARLPAEGIVIPLPPHVGPVTLTFDLHNRHTYSEEQVLAKR